MRVSIVTGDGRTTYTETIPQVETKENFSTVMDEATAAVQQDETAVAETKSLQEIFQEAADTYQVDIELLKAIAKQESNFQQDATSSSGAQGIMQLMPATAEGLGVEDAYDPYQNIMGGAKLISKLLKQYNGDVSLALAAYNAGSGNVAKYGGIPPFEETQNYVVKVQQYYQQGVEIPQVNVAVQQEEEQVGQQLVSLLSELPKHASYPMFLEQMQQVMAQETEQDSDAQVAYRRLLGNSNQAILNMLSTIS